jgi:hypothetical protein
MKKFAFAIMISLLAPTTACSYGSAVAIGKNRDRVLILRNDMFLFGGLRTAYICKASDAGLVDCQDEQSP